MQGKLPDISTAFSFWRQYAVNSLDRKNYNGAAYGLYNINALLTDDYIVEIDNDAYKKKTAGKIFRVCPHCEKESLARETPFHTQRVSNLEAVLYNSQEVNVWDCPHCNESVEMSESMIVREIRNRPFYLKVIPECPVRNTRLSSRNTFEPNFRKWFFNFLEELTHQLALYRIEYISQNNEDMSDAQYVDKGDG